MSDYDDEQRGTNAENLLRDPLLRKALEASREAIISEWETTNVTEGREYLWKLHRASVKFEEILIGYVQQGKIAKANLKEGKTVTERLRSVF